MNKPPVAGINAISPIVVPNVDRSSCPKYAARSIHLHCVQYVIATRGRDILSIVSLVILDDQVIRWLLFDDDKMFEGGFRLYVGLCVLEVNLPKHDHECNQLSQHQWFIIIISCSPHSSYPREYTFQIQNWIIVLHKPQSRAH